MNDFDDDFDNFEDDNFDDFNQKNSLKDAWDNSPFIKIFVVIAVIVLIIAAIFIFGGSKKEDESRINNSVDDRDVLGGNVSANYTEAIEDVNRQRLEKAVQTGNSTIPMLVNSEEQELLSNQDELPPYEDFDPLKTFRDALMPEDPEPVDTPLEDEPVLLEPQDVFPQGGPQQQVPAPSPEAIQALAQAMSTAAGNILGEQDIKNGRITYVTPENYYELKEAAKNGAQMVDTNGDGIPDTPVNLNDSLNDTSVNQAPPVIETILIPSGTINYAQILIEANSDIPGPVLAQLVSGPLSGARLIGSFTVQNKKLVLNFSSIVVNGVNQPVDAIAIDPNTTLPGVATEVDNRYWQRVIIPAAARFIEGVGSAIAQDTETKVTVSGDTVVQETKDLDLEQELGRGAQEGFSEIADFMSDEASGIQPLIRVMRGTPVGIFFKEPVLELN